MAAEAEEIAAVGVVAAAAEAATAAAAAEAVAVEEKVVLFFPKPMTTNPLGLIHLNDHYVLYPFELEPYP